MTAGTGAIRFPNGFLWGAATSAYQIEGSPLADGAKPSILHRYAHTPGNTYQGQTGDVAADHYHRFRDDIALMKELGLQAYQFSIAWPRVIPDGIGTVNAKGIDFYDRLVDLLLEAGIKPVPILHVWDFPGTLQDRGGWANRDSAEWFAEFATVVYERLGDRPTHWLTICEPSEIVHGGYITGGDAPAVRDLYAGLRAAHHVLLAHGRAVQAFRASGARGQIGTSTAVEDFLSASDSEADMAAAARARTYSNELYLDPVLLGRYPPQMAEWFGDAWPEVTDGDLAIISAPLDFVGVTYYAGSVVAHQDPKATGDDEGHDPIHALLKLRSAPVPGPRTRLGWLCIHPKGLTSILTWLRDRYGNPPIIITENGATFDDAVAEDGTIDDADRLAYLRDHLVAARSAIDQGVDLRGYFVWSLLDTWEFCFGYRFRFGIVHVDYGTQRRTIKRSGYWFRDVMAANGFEII